MSQSCYIDIIFEDEYVLNFIEILLGLENAGWNYNDYGKITYRPLGDNDDYEWVTEDLDKIHEIKNIIKEKNTIGESIGMVLCFNNTEVGGTLSWYSQHDKNQISFSPNINRQTLKHPGFSNMTDISWYLDRILPAFVDRKIGVKGIEVSDYY